MGQATLPESNASVRSLCQSVTGRETVPLKKKAYPRENQRGRESFLDLQEEIEEVDGNAGGRPPALWKGTKGSGIFS
jgi:hypothetical protein